MLSPEVEFARYLLIARSQAGPAKGAMMQPDYDRASGSIVDPDIRALVDDVRANVLGRRHRAEERIDEALERSGIADFDRGALLMVKALIRQHDHAPSDLLSMVDEAIALLADDAGDLLVSALTFAAALTALQGDLDACIARSFDFIDHVVARGSRGLPPRAKANYASTLVRLGAFQVAAEYLMDALVDLDGTRELRVAAVASTSLLLAVRGDLAMRPVLPEQLASSPHDARLDRLVHVAGDIVGAENVEPEIAGIGHGILAHVHLLRGDERAAVDCWDRLERESAKTHPIFIEYFRVTEARVAMKRGDHELAHRLLEPQEESSVLEVFPTSRIETLQLRAGLFAEVGDYEAAHRLTAEALALALDKPSLVPDTLIRQAAQRAEIEHQQRLLLERNVELDEQSRSDALTGLGNRRALAEWTDTGPVAPCAVLLIDLDHFKLINDTFGHAVGDSVLTTVANVVRKTCRPTDPVFRLGGEEFLIALREVKLEDALGLGERVRAAIEREPWQNHGVQASVTCSIGVSVGPSDQVTSVIEVADSHMYAAKQAGRNQVRGGATPAPTPPTDRAGERGRASD